MFKNPTATLKVKTHLYLEETVFFNEEHLTLFWWGPMFQRQCLKSSPTFFLREKRVIDYVYYLNFRKYLKSSSYLGWFSPFGCFFFYIF